MFHALGALIFRHRWLTLVLAGASLALSIAVLLRGGDLTTGKIDNLESGAAQALADEVLGRSQDTTLVVVFQGPSLDPHSEAFGAAITKALAPLKADPRVASVVTPDDGGPFLGPRMLNAKAHSAFALVTLKGGSREALEAYPALRARLRSDELTITCTGKLAFVHDLDHTLERDLLRAEIVSLPLALLVLLLVFGSAVAAAVPVGVGGLAVMGGMAVVMGLSRSTDMAQYTVNVCSLIGLGVAIDYSLFTVSRYREELAAGWGYEEALCRAMATAGRVVVFSGIAVGIGLAGLLFFEGSYLWAMGLGGAVVVLLAVVFALTFLPALLAVLGPRIHAGRLPFGGRGLGSGFWHATATWVMKRPVLVLLPTLAVLLLMGLPFLHLRLAAADVRVLDADVEARHGYDLLRADFPAEAATRIVVAVRFPTAPVLTAPRVGALFDFSRRLARLPGVARVESIVDPEDAEQRATLGREDYQENLVSPPEMAAYLVGEAKKLTVGERVTLLDVVTEGAPDSEEARGLVRAIRAERAVGDGTLLVGGGTANDVDTTEYMLSRMPRAVAFIVGVTVVVLFLLLGSVVLPLKAVAMNLVSIAGAFGALVWVFQDAHLFVHVARPIEPTLPVLLFCSLFGLSMDYEVLMLSRIKESYERTGDNTQAVADGLEKTAGLITSAAAIMVVVFGAFSLAHVVLVQAMGFGMAVAVALDATLVRVLLVPATMRLFGSLNWWAPRWMLAGRRVLVADLRPHG